MRRRLAFLLSLSCALCWGCSKEESPAAANPPAAVAAAPKAESAEKRQDPRALEGLDQPPKIPQKPGANTPSFAAIHGDHYDAKVHLDTESCSECHAETVEEWRDSVHAIASFNNPFYAKVFDGFVEAKGFDKAGFCGGCHDPTLTLDGSIKELVKPTDKRAHAGVTCNTCHGIVDATLDGNASYVLSTQPVPFPKEGDEKSLEQHRARVAPAALRTNALCVSCHRGFLTPDSGHKAFVVGLDEFGPWRGSPYNGVETGKVPLAADAQDCVSCHMPKNEHGKASHRFAGGHSTLAHMVGSPKQIAAVKAMVQSAATIDIPGLGQGKIMEYQALERLAPGKRLWFDVVVHNQGVGHHFPGGAKDLRDTWVEVEIRDRTGRVVATAGTEHEKTGTDKSAHRLRVMVADDHGQTVAEHRVEDFRTPAFDHTISPKDSGVVRYAWNVPADFAAEYPVEVTARLRHRRLDVTFHQSVCEHTKKGRGKELLQETQKQLGIALDPCTEQPIIEVAEVRARIGDPTPATQPKPAWKRFYEHGLGLQHQVQESLAEPTIAFERALEELGSNRGRERAVVLVSLGQVLSRQGRTEDAMDKFAEAEKIVGEHPSIHYARGRAHHRVFRLEEAVQWYEKASALVDDDRIWRQLAIAAGSISNNDLNYAAARKGLVHEPRDAHLLRSQMLALRKRGAAPEWVDDAKQAFSAFKRDPQAPHIRSECSASSEECRLERTPLRVHEMTTAK